MPPSLANRLLFHTSPAPAHIFSSPNLQGAELTTEIYDFLALALRAYVNPWWSKITRYDRDLLPHTTTHILIHLIRILESRCASVDWQFLIFHDIPAILTQHYKDFRTAQAKLTTAYSRGGAASLSELFAAMQPHMAFLEDGDADEINPEYYRQVFDHVLAVCLPPEDYEPEAERFIIREVLLNVILVDLIPRITQPWFIHKLLLGDDTESPPSPSPSSSSWNLLVIALSAIQALSGFCLALIHAYKQAIKLIHQHTTRSHHHDRHQPMMMYILQFISELISTSSNFAPSLILSILFALSSLSFSFLLPSQQQQQPLLDSLLPSLLLSHLSSPSFILSTTRKSKLILFPNGYPGPPPPVPSLEEQQLLRERLTNLWRRRQNTLLATLVFGPDPTKTLEAAIDPLGDERCNRRLVVFLLDRLLGALVPELLTGPS